MCCCTQSLILQCIFYINNLEDIFAFDSLRTLWSTPRGCCEWKLLSATSLNLLKFLWRNFHQHVKMSWFVLLDTSHSNGTNPVFITMQSGLQGCDMNIIPQLCSVRECKSKQEFPAKTLRPLSTLHTHPFKRHCCKINPQYGYKDQ